MRFESDKGGKVLRGLRLTEAVREIVRRPLGSLIAEPPEKSMLILKDIIKKDKPIKLFAVGDFVTSNMSDNGITANLFVIDNKIMRNPVGKTLTKGRSTIAARNPAGMISSEALEAVKRAVGDSSITSVIIDGEEDLLTLPVIKFAPLGAIVVYGQPGSGLVIVRVTETKKKRIRQLIDRMEVMN